MTTETDVHRELERAASRLEVLAAELKSVAAHAHTPDSWLEVRAKVGIGLSAFDDEISSVDRAFQTTSARGRLLRFFQLRVGSVVTKEELSGVGGISEWARRIRELRQDHGWAIHSAVSRPDLRVGDYVLVLDRPDPRLSRAWTLARQMKTLRTAGGVLPPKTRVERFLGALYPEPADREQLAHVAGSSVAAERAVDELKKDGWAFTVIPDTDPLAPGGLALLSSPDDAPRAQ